MKKNGDVVTYDATKKTELMKIKNPINNAGNAAGKYNCFFTGFFRPASTDTIFLSVIFHLEPFIFSKKIIKKPKTKSQFNSYFTDFFVTKYFRYEKGHLYYTKNKLLLLELRSRLNFLRSIVMKFRKD